MTNNELGLEIDVNMFLMLENRIIVEICHFVLGYIKANNEYMINGRKKDPSCLTYLDTDDLCRSTMSKEVSFDGFG